MISLNLELETDAAAFVISQSPTSLVESEDFLIERYFPEIDWNQSGERS